MTKKKKIIITITVIDIIVVMGVLTGIYLYYRSNQNDKVYPKTTVSQKEKNNSKEKIVDTLTEVEKEIVGIDTVADKQTEIKEENYSELYKEYLKLPEEEKEKSEVVPRKQEVPMEQLEEIKKNLEEDTKNNNQKEQEKTKNNNQKEQEKTKNNNQKEQEKTKNDNQKEQEKNKNQEKQEDENKIPEKFNLADKIDIKVEHQGNFGLCWDFSSIKPLETHLALKNIGNYDLSEIHLDYIESDLLYGNRTVHQGGNFDHFKKYITESGVVLESEAPYRDYTETEYNKFSDIKKVVEVTETVDFPSISKGEDSNYTNEEIAEFRETVKRHIMKNGGLYCVIATPDYGTKYLNTSTNAECFLGDWDDLPKGREIHAVTIVGWDDNYPKENFNEGMRPKNNGAYIILNSWGTSYGNAGYYYVSYEDKYIECDLSGIVSTSMENAYKISSIKNQAIKNYLIKNYGHLFINYEGEEYITKNAISNIYSLDLSNSNMTSLEDIEIFANIYCLNVSNNNIKDITPLTKLASLSEINLSNNNITDISSFKDMKTSSLYNINLSNNKIKDVSALSNVQNKFEYGIALDISGNPDVNGYDKINSINDLNISDCNIKDVSNLKKLYDLTTLKIANTPGVQGLEVLSGNLYELDISNCGIDKIPNLNAEINYLNVSNNNLSTLDGIQNIKSLYSIDVSGNPITDWSALREINWLQDETNEQDEEEYYDDYYGYDGISITADDCNIDDITIFNDLDFLTTLSLKNNKIKDVSKFSNEKVYRIDLSDNKNITGLQGLSKIFTVFLNNCNINNMDEVLKLESVYELSLENNNLTNISDISKLKELESLSLADNEKLSGTISSERMYTLNLSNCGLNDSFDFSKVPNVAWLNISKNPDISNIFGKIKNMKNEYMSLIVDELDFEDFEKIKSDDSKKNLYISGVTINLNYNLPINGNKIDLSKYKLLKTALMKNMTRGQINVKNGHLSKNGYIIKVDDISKGFVEIKFNGWNEVFCDSTIKVVFKSNEVKSNTITNNTIDKNTVVQNTLKNNLDTNTQNTLTNSLNTNTQNVLNSDNSSIQNSLTINNTVTDTQNTLNSDNSQN